MRGLIRGRTVMQLENPQKTASGGGPSPLIHMLIRLALSHLMGSS